MPFGLTTAVSTVQCIMDDVLEEFLWDFFAVYLDDIIIFSTMWPDHLNHLRAVFRRLREANLKIIPLKCFFAQTVVNYLGHVVSYWGISPHKSKMSAVCSFPPLSTVAEIRSFLGLAGYYRKFIRGFSTIAQALAQLTRDGVHFYWTPDCQRIFDCLKKALTSSPILVHPDIELTFVLQTDWSKRDIGAILAQRYTKGRKKRLRLQVASCADPRRTTPWLKENV